MGAAILDLDAVPKRKREPKKPSTSKPRKTARWRLVCRSLRLDGPMTKAAISKDLGLSIKSVTFYIEWYLKHGVVERMGLKKYKLTEKGKDWGKPRPRAPRKPRLKRPTMWDMILEEACDEDD